MKKRIDPTTGLLLTGLAMAAWRFLDVKQLPQQMIQQAIEVLNQKRLAQADKLDYIIMDLPPLMPAMPEHMNPIQQRIFGKPTLSLAELDLQLRRVAKDPRVKGVILNLPVFMQSLADLQTLRDSIFRLRDADKQVIAFATNLDTATYYVASACDSIVLQPGGMVMITGISRSITFMKDALAAVGLEVERVAISPYKSAMDAFAEQEMSPELRAQLDWLMDSTYAQLVDAIAAGRGQSADSVHQWIDDAPYTDTEAVELGIVDALCNLEGLSAELQTTDIMHWEKAQNLVPLIWHPRPQKYVAVLALSGMIMDGESYKPPRDLPLPFVGGERIGSHTVANQIRHLMQDESVAALVVQVDSPGGSATASEAIAAALDEFAQTRPVVVHMNGVAASGGYYISTPAHWIVAQPGTLTGSIGVIAGKVVGGELLEKLRFNEITLSRGKNATMFHTQQPFTEEQRQKAEAQIRSTYQQFLDRVAVSRHMTSADVDAVGAGRVWTGAQALEHGLIDALGDLQSAIAKARELAQLDAESPAFLSEPEKKPLAPQLAAQFDPAASFEYVRHNVQATFNGQAQMLLPMWWRW